MLKKITLILLSTLITTVSITPIQQSPAFASSAVSPVKTCKVKTVYKGSLAEQPWLAESNPGFPKGPNRLKSKGIIKAAMIFVEFTDVKGTDNPITEARKFTGFFNEYWNSVTRNKLRFDFQVHPKYISINKPSITYGMDSYGAGDASKYLADAITAADPLVNFTGVDVVYVIPPAAIKNIVYGPAFPLDSGGNAIKTKEGLIYSAAVGGSDSRNSSDRLKGVWLAHETGHLFGLPHPYESKNIAAWDLMHWDSGAPELLGWSRFVNGWIADSEVDCLDFTKVSKSTTSHLLEPLSRTAKGKKLVVVKVSNHKVLVLETRRVTKADRLTKNEEGVIAYFVDMKKYGDYYINLVGPNTSKNRSILATNKPGSSLRVDRSLNVKFETSTQKGDSFTINFTKRD